MSHCVLMPWPALEGSMACDDSGRTAVLRPEIAEEITRKRSANKPCCIDLLARMPGIRDDSRKMLTAGAVLGGSMSRESLSACINLHHIPFMSPGRPSTTYLRALTLGAAS